MYKLIFDSDALIKLIKAKSPREIFKNFEAFIANEVYDECVTEGKKAFFEDAFAIESLVEEGLIKKIKIKKDPKIQRALKDENFGKGEVGSLYLYRNIKADAICSDDERFLNFLDDNQINFIMPADLVVRLKEIKVISKEKTSRILDGLKPFIKESAYLKLKNQIGDKR